MEDGIINIQIIEYRDTSCQDII